jgi:hypothetical protein
VRCIRGFDTRRHRNLSRCFVVGRAEWEIAGEGYDGVGGRSRQFCRYERGSGGIVSGMKGYEEGRGKFNGRAVDTIES